MHTLYCAAIATKHGYLPKHVQNYFGARDFRDILQHENMVFWADPDPGFLMTEIYAAAHRRGIDLESSGCFDFFVTPQAVQELQIKMEEIPQLDGIPRLCCR
eukprot:CAMPEP_0175163886 /NCGR_PEP_ID=MMETSP0087-20121206/26046_1 /TAXON_ID=136419 /ORGANISM="Unknown Unknown, Strain D1" /LENGTH=101 /DNA_ID=CAMNT_0016452735 /DNA_START=369 /DNA_END=670 /DNA_ORIENTATION=-